VKPGITFLRVWLDDDVVELRIEVCDGTSLFVNNVYVGHAELKELVEALEVFREHIHGGIKDIQFGAFGPEFAHGAFHARLHFRAPGRLFISTIQESDFSEFSARKVARKARLYLVSEPILLDSFIGELRQLASQRIDFAVLECQPGQ
jgi:hypothetical protein